VGREAPGIAGAILEVLDEILITVRLGPPKKLRRSLACTNIIQKTIGSVRRVCSNVRRWRDASMALRWTAAAMLEATKSSRRLKARSASCRNCGQLSWDTDRRPHSSQPWHATSDIQHHSEHFS
jgi:hypothetical protein